MALLEVDNLHKEFAINDGVIPRLLGTRESLKAVRGVDFSVDTGDAFGLVGESGAGKSTIGNLIARLYPPTEGTIRYDGANVHELSGDDLLEFRRSVQMVFQDPYRSLDPRYTVDRTLGEALKLHTDLDKEARQDRIAELLETVNLEVDHGSRYPHELSGGQLQRVSIATALSVDPDFLILDEPVSALDVSVQARILNLLRELQHEYDLAYLFISHDLGVVKHLCDRVAVLYLGEIVEEAPTSQLFDDPNHPYTEGLLGSVPTPDTESSDDGRTLEGEIASPRNPPSGCSFHPRCPYGTEQCREVNPPQEEVAPGRRVACHHWETVGTAPEPHQQ